METNLLVGFTVCPLELSKEENERKGEISSTVFHRNGNKQTLTFKKRLAPLRFLIEQKVQITINKVTKIGL